MRIEAVVRRKIRDLVRDAAEDLLVSSGAAPTHVDRAELWAFEVEGADASGTVSRILAETNLVVNPNIQRFTIGEAPGMPNHGCRLFVRVQERVDARGSSVLRTLRERRGIRQVTNVTRSVLWSIDFDRDERDVTRIAREITGAEYGAGILANPHAQEVSWKVVPA
jgi:hypothetical protein